MFGTNFVKTKPPTDVCCVGVHIQNGAFFIGLFCFVISCTLISIDAFNFDNTTLETYFPMFILLYGKKAYYHVAIDLVLNSAWAFSSIFLIYGNLRLRASFYWPFIAIAYLNIGIYVLKIPLFALAASAVFKDEVGEVPKGGRIPTSIQIVLLIGLNIMILLINWYTVGIITKAREFLLRHRQVRTESMRMEMRKCTLHLNGYHAPVEEC
ncbi:hypothetical protein M3Y97_00185500 [Aphelenchoides bicaudatus]|nr:hypothetical protein M3Y97_00185500 [Aphelenchoides bicaudatus]